VSRIRETYVALGVLVFSTSLLGGVAAYVQFVEPEPELPILYVVPPRSRTTCVRREGDRTLTFNLTNEGSVEVGMQFAAGVTCTSRSIEP
jgi:hypothetical protein